MDQIKELEAVISDFVQATDYIGQHSKELARARYKAVKLMPHLGGAYWRTAEGKHALDEMITSLS